MLAKHATTHVTTPQSHLAQFNHVLASAYRALSLPHRCTADQSGGKERMREEELREDPKGSPHPPPWTTSQTASDCSSHSHMCGNAQLVVQGSSGNATLHVRIKDPCIKCVSRIRL